MELHLQKNLQAKSNDRSFALLTFYSLSKFTVYLISLNNNLITHNQQVDPIIEIIFTHKSQEN